MTVTEKGLVTRDHRGGGLGTEMDRRDAVRNSTVVKRPKRFSFYLVGFYLMLS